MKYRLGAIADITEGKLVGSAVEKIADLLLDSRKATSGHEVLFVAIRGKVHDAHQYIPELYDRGFRQFLVEELPKQFLPGANFVVVEDSLKALQELAAYHRSQFHYPVVGITGSNGKTVVKEWLHQLLHHNYRLVRSPKSYNSQVGVPLSLWALRPDHQLALIEAGISQPGEMAKLQRMIRPTDGLFTMLGGAHAEFFESAEQKLKEKLKLFKNCSRVFYCSDQPMVKDAMAKLQSKGKDLCTWSRTDASATLFVAKETTQGNTTTLDVVHKGHKGHWKLPFTNHASLDNAMLCALYLLENDISIEDAGKRLSALEPIAMRLELLDGLHGNLLINDAYNSDPESVAIALDFLRQQKHKLKRVLVLSDLQQSGTPPDQLYKQVAQWVRDYRIDQFYGIGPELERRNDLFPAGSKFFPTTEAFLRALPELHLKDSLILLKGARVYKFERILDTLQQQSHDTVLEVNLSAMVRNLNYYRQKLAPSTKLMAMVKAFSYGAGTGEIAAALQFQKVDYLTVAYADEGVQLRQAGIELPILVMNPDEASFGAILQYKLEPEVYSFRILDLLLKHLLKSNFEGRNFPIHLKLDTGMHRLGFTQEDLPNLINRLRSEYILEVKTVFSHLAAADEPEHKSFTQEQIRTFVEMTATLERALGYKPIRHILNSSGIRFYPEAQLDMVRLGIGLYGISSDPTEREELQPVGRLRSIISQIKTVGKGESVGYSRSFIAQDNMRTGTVAIGYADGLRRVLSNGGGNLFVNGQAVPIVGKVCMDMCMIDLTGVEAKEGDEVEIFGPNQTVYELADRMGTIPYEVLTSISQRVKRLYFQES